MSKEHIGSLLLNEQEQKEISRKTTYRILAGYAIGGAVATAGFCTILSGGTVSAANTIENFDTVQNNHTVSQTDPTVLLEVGAGLTMAGLAVLIAMDPLSIRIEERLALRKLHDIQPDDIVVTNDR